MASKKWQLMPQNTPWWWLGHRPVDCPLLLYHYTSASSIYKIIESKHMRATHLDYSNDRMEFKVALEVAMQVISERQYAETDSLFIDFYEHAKTQISRDWEFPKFIVSLSAHENMLSQWRAYGGYSIAFNRDELLDVASDKPFRLLKCIYETDKQKAEIGDLLERSIQDLRKGQEAKAVATDFGMYFTLMATAFKHNSFHQEAEWRLVGFDGDHPDFDFHYDESKLIPFRKFHLDHSNTPEPLLPFRATTPSNSLCIDHFSLGPNNDQQLAGHSLKKFVKHQNERFKRGWKDVIVFDSPLKTK